MPYKEEILQPISKTIEWSMQPSYCIYHIYSHNDKKFEVFNDASVLIALCFVCYPLTATIKSAYSQF